MESRPRQARPSLQSEIPAGSGRLAAIGRDQVGLRDPDQYSFAECFLNLFEESI